MSGLARITITIEEELLEKLDELIAASGGGNRSEAIRDLVRNRLLEQEATSGSGEAVGTVTLVYDHRRRHLAESLVEAGHQHHHEILASMHLHLDHDHCLEVVAIQGKRSVLRRVADAMIGMKGVLHGKLVLSGVTPAKAKTHSHGGRTHRHSVVAAFLAAGLLGSAGSLRADDSHAPGQRPPALEAAAPDHEHDAAGEEPEAKDQEAESRPETSELRPLLVEGRAEKQVGVARSGSEGAVGPEQLTKRPILRNAELLEVIPGLMATQHSGSGKANQYFLRGFNLDHGTDFSVRIDGVPINLPSHGHGQGYLDLNGVIPELVRTVRYNKGPAFAETGDFSSAGSASLQLHERLDRGVFKQELGMHGYARTLLADSMDFAGGHLLYAADFTFYDGPWKLDEDATKTNALLKWTRGDKKRGVRLEASAYSADWNATDQIPLRAVRDGSLSRRGNVDPTDGGDTSRYTLTASGWRSGEKSHTHAQLYGVYYTLDLFSNFTYFLDDPVDGDQIHQHDRRGIFGGDVEHQWYGQVAGFDHETRVGLTLRHDSIPSVALRRSRMRQTLSTVRDDDVEQTSMALWGESTVTLHEKLRVIAGLRGDGYRFGVDSNNGAGGGTETDGIVSPKIALVAGPWEKTEAYFNFGTGFHSNDARGVNDPVAPADALVRSYGYEAGLRTEAVDGLYSSLAVFLLDLDSELLFVGDAGDTTVGDPTRRFGVEWANYWEPCEKTALDFDLTWTHSRFEDVPPGANRIPGSIPWTVSAGITQKLLWNFYSVLRARYLGQYALEESGAVKSGSTTLVNLRVGWEQNPAADDGTKAAGWAAYADFLNLLGSRDRDIAYYYESRLPGEAAGVEDTHFHPVEPFGLRIAVERRF
jgi:nickel-responsive transcriptional regulator NikR